MEFVWRKPDVNQTVFSSPVLGKQPFCKLIIFDYNPIGGNSKKQERIMDVWYEGCIDISCSLDQVENEYSDYGKIFVALVGCMPGITKVDLIETGTDFVVIETNEGTMKRTNIRRNSDDSKISVEFDEEYRAGSKVTGYTHYRDEFTLNGDSVRYCTILSDVRAGGFLGFLYRKFGNSNIGKAVLNSCKQHFESKTD